MSDSELLRLVAEQTGEELSQVRRAKAFIELGWMNAFLADLAIPTATKYRACDADGRVVESGELADGYFYVVAERTAGRFAGTAMVRRAIHAHAPVYRLTITDERIEYEPSIATRPVFVFLDEPTPAGKAAALRLATPYAEAPSGAAIGSRKGHEG